MTEINVMTQRRVLKWTVPVDDQSHHIGSGHVVHVACQGGPDTVQVWTEEYWVSDSDESNGRRARVYGTGHRIPEGWDHLGSVLCDGLVWHLYMEPHWSIE